MPPQVVPSEIAVLSRVLSKEQDPNWAATLCISAVINFVGNISQETWGKIEKVTITACDTPGCTCHEFQMEFLKSLIAAREYYTKAIDKKENEGGFSV